MDVLAICRQANSFQCFILSIAGNGRQFREPVTMLFIYGASDS